jgi:hypothetical protein
MGLVVFSKFDFTHKFDEAFDVTHMKCEYTKCKIFFDRLRKTLDFDKFWGYPDRVFVWWKKYGTIVYYDSQIQKLRRKIVKKKLALYKIFENYSHFCGECSGECCYPLWGAFKPVELMTMMHYDRAILLPFFLSKKREARRAFNMGRCIFWVKDEGCALPKRLRSLTCVTFMCGIFRSIIKGKERDKANKLIEELKELLTQLTKRMNELIQGV